MASQSRGLPGSVPTVRSCRGGVWITLRRAAARIAVFALLRHHHAVEADLHDRSRGRHLAPGSNFVFDEIARQLVTRDHGLREPIHRRASHRHAPERADDLRDVLAYDEGRQQAQNLRALRRVVLLDDPQHLVGRNHGTCLAVRLVARLRHLDLAERRMNRRLVSSHPAVKHAVDLHRRRVDVRRKIRLAHQLATDLVEPGPNQVLQLRQVRLDAHRRPGSDAEVTKRHLDHVPLGLRCVAHSDALRRVNNSRDRRYATNVPAIKVPRRWICTHQMSSLGFGTWRLS